MAESHHTAQSLRAWSGRRPSHRDGVRHALCRGTKRRAFGGSAPMLDASLATGLHDATRARRMIELSVVAVESSHILRLSSSRRTVVTLYQGGERRGLYS